MRRIDVAALVQRIVRVELSLAAAGLVACGGQSAAHATRGDASPDTKGDATAGDAKVEASAPSCEVVPDSGRYEQPNFTCTGTLYVFDGLPSECFPDGGLPCAEVCPGGAPGGCGLSVIDVDGASQLECLDSCCSCVPGRAPRGLRRSRGPRAGDPAAGALARMAYFEAASVPAFERLARELEAHGAPARLARSARRAARDEVRHARAMTRLAERAGARVERPRVARGPVRGLEAVARENAVEGCVRETFAAAATLAQAGRARDPAVRVVMARIARDELRHASLAWEVARWVEPRLTMAQRARVVRSRAAAARDVTREAAREPSPELVAALGVPDGLLGRRIAAAMFEALDVGVA